MADVVYVAKEAPKLRISGVNKKTLQFERGVLRLDSEADADTIVELDALIAKKPNLSQIVRKADKSAAEARLKAALAAEVAQRGTIAGGVNGDALSALHNLETRDQELLRHAAETGKDPAAVLEAAEKATDGGITVGGMKVGGVAAALKPKA